MRLARGLALLALAVAAICAVVGARAWLRRDDAGSRHAREASADAGFWSGVETEDALEADLHALDGSEAREAAAPPGAPIPKAQEGASLFPSFGSEEGATLVLRLRVFDPAGAPLSLEVRWRLVMENSWELTEGDGRATPDADGAIAVGWNWLGYLVGDMALHLSVEPNLAAEVLVPATEVAAALNADRELDLGDVALSTLDLVAAGHVVMPGGEPVANATVVLRFVDANGQAIPTAEQTLYTGPDGAFRFFGARPGESAQATLEAKRMIARSGPPRAVAFGETSVLLELHSVGRIGATVLHGFDRRPANLFVVATPSAGERPELLTTRALVSRSGAVELSDVYPGRYDVAVVASGAAEPFRVVRDVVVRDLEVTTPVALDPLDLRGALHPFDIEVRTAEGIRVPATVEYRPAGDEGAAWSTFQAVGDKQLATTSAALDLVVSRRGFASVRVDGAVRRAEIVLQPGLPVAIALADGNELPLCSADVKAVDDDGAVLAEQRLRKLEGEAVLTLPSPGRATITVVLECRAGDGVRLLAEEMARVERGERGTLDSDELQRILTSDFYEFTHEIDVLDSRELQRFVLTVPADVPRDSVPKRHADQAR